MHCEWRESLAPLPKIITQANGGANLCLAALKKLSPIQLAESPAALKRIWRIQRLPGEETNGQNPGKISQRSEFLYSLAAASDKRDPFGGRLELVRTQMLTSWARSEFGEQFRFETRVANGGLSRPQTICVAPFMGHERKTGQPKSRRNGVKSSVCILMSTQTLTRPGKNHSGLGANCQMEPFFWSATSSKALRFVCQSAHLSKLRTWRNEASK